MTGAEAQVLVAAAALVGVVIVERDTLSSRVGVFLLTLAMLASVAALLHMVAP